MAGMRQDRDRFVGRYYGLERLRYRAVAAASPCPSAACQRRASAAVSSRPVGQYVDAVAAKPNRSIRPPARAGHRNGKARRSGRPAAQHVWPALQLQRAAGTGITVIGFAVIANLPDDGEARALSGRAACRSPRSRLLRAPLQTARRGGKSGSGRAASRDADRNACAGRGVVILYAI